MIPLLCAAALIDTVCVIDDYNSVVIHEWGVITVSDVILMDGIPPESIDPHLSDIPYMDDRAPVVYFYGFEFADAEFSVKLPAGTFTSLFPLPNEMSDDSSTITWNIGSARNLGTYQIPDSDLPEVTSSSGWVMDEWRNGQAHVLEFENGTQDRFLFYECSIPSPEPLYPFTGTGGLDESFDGQVLVLSQSFEETSSLEMAVCNTDDISSGSLEMEPYSFNSVLSTLCTWSNGEMKSEELYDLWITWEEYIQAELSSGGQLLLFRIPESSVNTLTTISLSAPEIDDVTINRFYLGMVHIN